MSCLPALQAPPVSTSITLRPPPASRQALIVPFELGIAAYETPAATAATAPRATTQRALLKMRILFPPCSMCVAYARDCRATKPARRGGAAVLEEVDRPASCGKPVSVHLP